LPHGLFEDLRKLKILNLAHNQIRLISDRAFSCVQSLSFLDLSSNALIDISEHAFEQMTNSSSLVINLRRNHLKKPRRGWLILPRFSSTSCSQQAQGFYSYTPPKDEESLVRTRTIWGDNNPWECTCKSSSAALSFFKTKILIEESLTRKNNETCNEPEDCALIHQNVFPVRWSLDIPCSDLGQKSNRFNFDFPKQTAKAIYNSCCSDVDLNDLDTDIQSQNCRFVKDWSERNILVTMTNKSVTTENQDGFTNNHVTIIGIVIVVLCPILLTLCPDCNKTPHLNRQSDVHECLNPDQAKHENSRSSFSFFKKFSKSTKSSKNEKT